MSTAMELAIAFDYLTPREVACVKDIVQRVPRWGIAVNIGSGAGTSVIAVLEQRSDIVLYDIDINLLMASDQYIAAGVAGDSRLIRIDGDSKHVPWTYGKVDFLFVDGDHSEPGIRGDLEIWLPRMNDGGYVLLHDYWPYPAGHALAGVDYWPNVRAVADEMMSAYPVVADVDRLRVYQVWVKS